MSSQDEDVYRPPASQLEVVEATTPEREPATRWSRLLAVIVDGLLFSGVVLIVNRVVGQIGDPFALISGQAGSTTPIRLLWGVFAIVLFVVLQAYPLASWGQTWGKRLLGIRIVDMDGYRVPFARLILTRYVARDALLMLLQLSHEPILSFLFGLANVLLIFGQRRRCGHDLIAGTQVVRVPTPASLQAASRP